MIKLIGVELLKLRKRLMTRLLLFILMGMLAILYLLLLAVSKVVIPANVPHDMPNLQNLLGLPMAIPFAFSMLSSFGTILVVIFTAGSLGGEYGWGTLRSMLLSSESRARFLIAKLIAILLMLFVGMVIGLAAGFVMSLITTAIGQYSFDFSFITGHYLWEQFLQFWRTFFVIIPYVLLAFLFSIVGRSTMAGIAFAIGIFFFESLITTFMSLAGGWIAQIPNYLLAANTRAIMALNQLPEGLRSGMGISQSGSSQTPDVWQAAGVLTGYCILFLVLGFYLFGKRDITA